MNPSRTWTSIFFEPLFTIQVSKLQSDSSSLFVHCMSITQLSSALNIYFLNEIKEFFLNTTSVRAVAKRQ